MLKPLKQTIPIAACCLALLSALLLSAGCSPAAPAAIRQTDGSVLTIGTTMKIGNINVEDYYFGILRAIFTHKGLVRLNAQGEFTGDLAETWHSPDGRVWTFRLRPGMAWHDGQPLTSKDVKFTIEYNMATNVEYKQHFSRIETVTTPDDATLVISLASPNPRFLFNLLVLRTLPAHIFAGIDAPAAFNDPRAAIGSGPYIFEKFDANAGLIVFKANENYYRGRPVIREVRVRLYKNPDTLYMALQSGEIDLPYAYAGGTDPVYADAMARNSRIRLLNLPNPGVTRALIFNTAREPVNNPRVRAALAYAVNYQELVRLFAARTGVIPAAGFVPPGSPAHVATRTMEYNPAKARELLTAAGYRPDLAGFFAKQGEPLSIELLTRSDSAENARLAGLLQKYCRDIGVTLTVKAVDTTLYRTISDKEKSHTCLLARTTPWGMMMWAGLGTGYMDARNIGWAMDSDPAFVRLADQMNAALNREEYNRLAAGMQRYYAENLPAIALYWDNFIQPCSAAWDGWVVSPTYGVLNEDTWYSIRKVTP